MGKKKGNKRSRIKGRKKRKGRVIGKKETDKKQKQMSLYHHLLDRELSNAWAHPS